MKWVLGVIALVVVLGVFLLPLWMPSGLALEPDAEVQTTPKVQPPEGTPTAGTGGGSSCASTAAVALVGVLSVPLFLVLAAVRRSGSA
jgi:hypothetical protein